MFYRDTVDLVSYVSSMLRHFPGMESRNGAMLASQNELVERILEDARGRGSALSRIGGSDSHVLTRVGTTYTEAPAANREEFLESLRQGRSRVGGRHGNTLTLAREIYGVIFRYWASLLGIEREDLTGRDRLRDLGLSFASLPFQFLPFLIATGKKSVESRLIDRLTRRWVDYAETSAPREGARGIEEIAPL
jgi:hypothetical protein